MPYYLHIGLGKIGLEVANQLAMTGNKVTAISRSQKPNLAHSVSHIQADARYVEASQLSEAVQTISHICIIVSPDSATEQGYRDSYYAISENIIKLSQSLPNLQRVVYISSTGIYGQDAGDIIEINTPINLPRASTSQVLLATEQLLQNAFGDNCTIIRPSGIYGADRLRLLNMVKNIANGQDAPANTWTNRIFDTDLVQIIINVLQAAKPLPVYLATDHAPAPLYEVLTFLAEQMAIGITLPTTEPLTGKRIVHNLPQNWLMYPSYREGYQHILATANI